MNPHKPVSAVAYPGLPFLFAEGIREPFEERVSSHNSVGLAITDVGETVRTETTVSENPSSPKDILLVDDAAIDEHRARGMYRIIEEMKNQGGYVGGLRVSSHNHDIKSGSSDSGAAALVTALDAFLSTNLSLEEKLAIGHYGSETVFRSLYGGLTEYIVDDAPQLKATELASSDELADLVIYAVPFEGGRKPADLFHRHIQKHPHFPGRKEEIAQRTEKIRSSLENKDLPSLLAVMQRDAETFHRMAEDLGIGVLSKEMKEVVVWVNQWKKEGLPVFWTAAAGLQLYLATTREHKGDVQTRLLDKTIGFTDYKVAGKAKASSEKMEE